MVKIFRHTPKLNPGWTLGMAAWPTFSRLDGSPFRFSNRKRFDFGIIIVKLGQRTYFKSGRDARANFSGKGWGMARQGMKRNRDERDPDRLWLDNGDWYLVMEDGKY